MRPHSLLAFFLLAAAAGSAQDVVSIEGRLQEGSAEKDGGARLARTQAAAAPSRAVADLGVPPEIGLAPLETEAALVRRVRAARRVGRVRASAADGVETGAWTALPDGRFVWRLAIRSPAASELRVHFTEFNAGSGKVWIYSDNPDGRVQEFTGQGLFGDGDFWSSTISAERVTIEYLAENGLREDGPPPFQIAEIGHMWEATSPVVTQSAQSGNRLSRAKAGATSAPSGLSLAAAAGPGREIAGCHLDVACFPEFRTAASGVARILFAVGPGLYVCSGSLVNTKSGNGTPLFLTASHCIDNEASARSVQANFFYESESCGGGLRQVEEVLGANYLISESFSRGDYSLIRLLGLPKSSVYFFGITTEEPAIGVKLTGIHHPEGSYKRISFGPRTPDESIAVSDGTGLFVSPADRYYQVDQREGRTEGGSSGSPLLNSKKQLIGTLSSGPVFSGVEAEDEVLMCLADQVIDQYGRLSKAWPNLQRFINDLRPGQMALPQAGDKLTS